MNATAPSDYTIKIKYKMPKSAYPFVDKNATTFNASSQVDINMYYTAVCQTEGHPEVRGINKRFWNSIAYV